MGRSLLVGLLLILAGAGMANAIVVNVASTSETLTITDYEWNLADLTLTLYEKVSGPNASLEGDVSDDPLVWVRKEVQNDTNFAWAAYQIDVTMPVQFTLPQLAPMAGWQVVASPVLPTGDGKWTATLVYSVTTGAMVAPGAWGEFDFQVWIPDAVKFCVDQTPFAPEPASLALLLLGGLLIRRSRR